MNKLATVASAVASSYFGRQCSPDVPPTKSDAIEKNHFDEEKPVT